MVTVDGQDVRYDRLVIATGHHRNGYLLAPITADAVAGLVTDGVLPVVARPFTLARFGRPEPRRVSA